MSDEVRGTLRGERGALLFADVTLTHGDDSRTERHRAGEIVLVGEDGEAALLEGIESAKKVGRLELAGAWSELASHPAAALFGEDAPGAQARVSLRGFVLFGGDRIECVGEPVRTKKKTQARLRVRRISMDLPRSPEAPTAAEAPPPVAPAAAVEVRTVICAGRVEVEPGALVLADATLVVGASRTREQRASTSLTLRADDGRAVRVVDLERAARVGHVHLRGPYGELVAHPVARLFASSAPGDHVSAMIEGFAVAGGDRIAIEGEVIEESLGEGAERAGLRTAPARVVTAIRATRIAIGEDPERRLSPGREPAAREPAAREDGTSAPDAPPPAPAEPKKRVHIPFEGSTRVYAILGALLLGSSLLLGALAPLVPERAWLTPLSCAGAAFVVLAASRWLRVVHHASHASHAGISKRRTTLGPLWGHGADWGLLAFYAFALFVTALEVAPRYVLVVSSLLAALPMIHALVLAVHEAPFRAFAARVLSFASGDPRSGRMVLVEGRVASEAVAMRRRVDFYMRKELSHSTAKDGSERTHTSYVLSDRESTSAHAFTLESGALRIEVEPHGAAVAFANRTWEPRVEGSAYTEVLAPGAPVCVVGRFEEREGTLRVRVGGDESLFVFAGSRAQLVRARLMAWLRPLAVAGIGLLPVLLGTSLVPFAARYRAWGVVDSSSSPSLPVGTECEARVLAYHYGVEPRCTLRLECGGETLYGGFGMGQTACNLQRDPRSLSVFGYDDDDTDGDPAVRFDLAGGSIEWGYGLAHITLEDATPTLFY